MKAAHRPGLLLSHLRGLRGLTLSKEPLSLAKKNAMVCVYLIRESQEREGVNGPALFSFRT